MPSAVPMTRRRCGIKRAPPGIRNAPSLLSADRQPSVSETSHGPRGTGLERPMSREDGRRSMRVPLTPSAIQWLSGWSATGESLPRTSRPARAYRIRLRPLRWRECRLHWLHTAWKRISTRPARTFRSALGFHSAPGMSIPAGGAADTDRPIPARGWQVATRHARGGGRLP
jgi:hypothetical protein